jgi:nitrate reductase NapD
MNISSAIIHAQPGQAEAVLVRLAEVSGVEVHAVSPEGKIIVTLEAEDDAAVIRSYEIIGLLDGVLSAAMVYNQTESEPEKEI